MEIREKFETLDFGGQNVAVDFLPPRKDIDLDEIGVQRKDDVKYLILHLKFSGGLF